MPCVTRCGPMMHRGASLHCAIPAALHRIEAVTIRRPFSTSRVHANEEGSASEGEKRIHEVLVSKFPEATSVKVEDISGGCGSMYEINLTSPEFAGKRTVLQHKMVTNALAEEIKDMHGLRIYTSAS